MNLSFSRVRIRFSWALVLPLALFTACQTSQDNQVVARVSGSDISVADYKRKLTEYGIDFSQQTPRENEKLKSDILNELIEERILLLEAKQKKILVTDAELDQHIENVRFDEDPDAFKKRIAQQGDSYQAWRERVKSGIMIKKAMIQIGTRAAAPTEREIAAYYEQHRDQFERPESFQLQQIVVEKKSEAQEILKSLLRPAGSQPTPETASFEALAKKNTIAPEAKSGGRLGWMTESELPPEVAREVTQMKIGRISSIIETVYGFHIVKLLEKRPARAASFKEVSDDIKAILWDRNREASFFEWKQDVFSKLRVERNYGLIEKL